MLEILEPTDVIVHGYMPDSILGDLYDKTNFHHYPNHFEKNCRNEV